MRSLFRGGRRAAVLKERLPETTYVELVRSLFGLVLPAVIMTLCFAVTGAYVLVRHHDWVLQGFYALGLVVSASRMVVLFGHRKDARSETLGGNVARVIEKRFAITYIGFAAAFGGFAARGCAIVDPDVHVLLVALIFGYGAGVAATTSLRPWISMSAILIAIVPMVVVSLFQPGAAYWGTGLLTALFLGGGVLSMFQRYNDSSGEITLRRLMEQLAREDSLTGLPNRLVLRERFDQLTSLSEGSELIAVHCVDINQLDPVNEMYGHMAGDALLKAVAQRMRRVVRGENLVIHLNGDDFVIIQPNMESVAAAETLAHQVVATLDKSYMIAGEDIIITANIGYAVDLQSGARLEELLLGAERALSSGKRQASGVAIYDRSRWGSDLHLPN